MSLAGVLDGVLALECPVRMYAWGSLTALPELLGSEPDGTPQAELWVGDHPAAPAVTGGTPLNRLVAERPDEVLGSGLRSRHGDRLPFLLKVLAVARPLSLQVHPDATAAAEGFAADEAAGLAPKDPARRYTDPYPKPEIAVALTPFEAFVGFRSPLRTAELLRQVPVRRLQSVADMLEARPDEHGVRAAVEDLFARPDDRMAAITSALSFGDVPPELRPAQQLCAAYPGDHGAVVTLLMQHCVLAPGDAVRVPAGVPHTYQRGMAVEVMSASDNVLRGGLTPKHVDVPELLSVLRTDPDPRLLVGPRPLGPGICGYDTGAPEFALWRVQPGQGTAPLPGEGPRLLLCTDGTAEVTAAGAAGRLRRGRAALVPACAGPAELRGDATVWVAAEGHPDPGQDVRRPERPGRPR